MNHNNLIEKFVMDAITTQKKGVSLTFIKEYLEYYNQTTYTEEEVEEILMSLLERGKVLFEKNHWKPIS